MNLLKNSIGQAQAEALCAAQSSHQNLKTLCGLDPNAKEIDLAGQGLGSDGAILVASEIKVNRALTSIKINDYALPVDDIKTKPVLDLSNTKLGVEDAIIVAALLPLNEALTKIVWGEGTKIFTMDTSTEAIDFSGNGLAAHDAQIVAWMLPKCT